MIELNVTKQSELGLFQAEATLTLPPLTVVRHKADRDDLEYELRRAFEELVGEIVSKQIKDEF
jgi:hypothetical protein